MSEAERLLSADLQFLNGFDFKQSEAFERVPLRKNANCLKNSKEHPKPFEPQLLQQHTKVEMVFSFKFSDAIN